MAAEKAKIAVLVSGGGTNLQALIDAQSSGVIKSGEIVLVISNNKNAYALTRAENAGIESLYLSKKSCGGHEEFEASMIDELDRRKIDLIILAGFMSILSPDFTKHYEKRIINIHPSLIPSFCGEGFYGLKVHEAALAKGVKVTGATVHYVNEIPDGGEIIMQKAVNVIDGDTPEILQRRVMEQAEWLLLPASAEKISAAIVEEKEKKRNIPMDIYKINDIAELIKDNSYVGRGIVIGKTPDAKHAVAAYFIMGRSSNSRNRIFREIDGKVITEAFDPSKLEDPSLIIYTAINTYKNNLIVTNGNQTDDVYAGLAEGKSFSQSLVGREFEPDGPTFTPRISGLISFGGGDFNYGMSILKSADAEGTACNRYTFSYPSIAGLGHFIHTYVCDGNPIPTFQGEPERVAMMDDIDDFTTKLWNALNADNKISLYVRYVDLETGITENRLINKNQRTEE